jgi:hypothetical protein
MGQIAELGKNGGRLGRAAGIATSRGRASMTCCAVASPFSIDALVNIVDLGRTVHSQPQAA